jgi:hypothetical protein
MVWLMAKAWPSIGLCSWRRRSTFSSCGVSSAMFGRRRAGAGAVDEAEAAVEVRAPRPGACVFSKSSAVSPGKPTMKSDDRRNVGPRGAQLADQ